MTCPRCETFYDPEVCPRCLSSENVRERTYADVLGEEIPPPPMLPPDLAPIYEAVGSIAVDSNGTPLRSEMSAALDELGIEPEWLRRDVMGWWREIFRISRMEMAKRLDKSREGKDKDRNTGE